VLIFADFQEEGSCASYNKQSIGCNAQLPAQLFKHFLRWPIDPVN